MTTTELVILLLAADYLLMWLIWLWLTLRLLKKFFARNRTEEQMEDPKKTDANDGRLARNEELVDEIAQGDPALLDALIKLARIESAGALTDSEKRLVASRVSEDALHTLHVAARQSAYHFDISRRSTREPVGYPTNDMEPVQMTDWHQMSEVTPEDLLLPADRFVARLAMGDLLVQQAFETTSGRGRIYVLQDISPSMDALMQNGAPRYSWAYGISVSLAINAMRGEAQFYRREFDQSQRALVEVNDEGQARALLERILTQSTTGNGTAIYAALKQAVKDIREGGRAELGDNILLITDGEDESLPKAATLRKLLGDIKLHVAAIGNTSPVLQAVATTFQTFK